MSICIVHSAQDCHAGCPYRLPPVCEPGKHVIDSATYRCVKCRCVYTSPQDQATHAREISDELDATESRWPADIR